MFGVGLIIGSTQTIFRRLYPNQKKALNGRTYVGSSCTRPMISASLGDQMACFPALIITSSATESAGSNGILM